jgi:redox-sensitive bicupin YhaK (pirin superfamily)
VFVHLDDYYPTFVNSQHGCIRLLLGAWDGRRALVAPIDGFWMLDVDVAPGKELRIPVSPRGALGVLTTGSLVVDGVTVNDTAVPMVLPAEGDAIRLASETGASLMVFPRGFAHGRACDT